MTTQKPLIGITTYGRDENKRFHLPAVYVEAVRRAGGLPILIPPGEEAIEQLLPLLDGIILPGGGDVSPELYSGTSHETIYNLDPERDSSEINLVRILIDQDVPLLGICRGLQVINVALGGTLIEHLPDEVGEETLHRAQPRLPISHEVNIAPGSHLADIMGQTTATATSWHHQAIRKPAPGLKIVANAPDGTIEAVEMPDHPWLVAVQWHPELSAATDAEQQHIFDELVAVAREKMLAKRAV